VFTANFADNDELPLPPAVIDRLLVIEVPALSRAATRHIAEAIYREVNVELADTFAHEADDAVFDRLTQNGLRQVKRLIQDGFGFAAQAGRRTLSVADIQAAEAAAAAPKRRRIGF